ncbi:MAG: hypothetical protein KGR98_02355 [Verrucomicrobia bacterium]|nr:hypothetical protein [Verrucomicrobiota bacterium]MDE3100272.1 hypothetical protein [Verrucomicrobiota bacterium]
MSDPQPPAKPPRYKWPWVVLAAVILFVILAIIWMGFAVQKVRQERGFSPAARAR